MDWLWYGFCFSGFYLAVYLLVRIVGIAYFRTRAEFERGSFRKPKFMKGDGDGSSEE